MSEKPVISAVIITKNEEKNIKRCLESLEQIADEIIVLDSFSTDKTPEICKTHQVQFIQTEWKGYAETKNYGNSLAKGDYILSIDADEALSNELRNTLKQFKAAEQKPDICIVNRLTSFCGTWIHHCGWYPDSKPRIWRNGSASWKGLVHETLEFEAGSSKKHIKGDLLHYSYYSINEYLQQMIHYSDLAANENFDKGKKYSLLKLVLSPLAKFFSSYIIKGGFRDGFYGFLLCSLMSAATLLKYAKTRQLYMQKS